MQDQAISGEIPKAETEFYISEKLLDHDLTLLDAALALADGGLKVVPTTSQPTAAKPTEDASKNPGGVLGKGWQIKSSAEPAKLREWFTPPATASSEAVTLSSATRPTDWYRWVPFDTVGLAVHAGPAIVIADVDNPEHVPDGLWPELNSAPFQSSSSTDPRRGHYYFLAKAGHYFGQTATVKVPGGQSCGELRHGNAVAVSSPSKHKKANLGRRYQWQRAGVIPAMSDALAKFLESEKRTADWNGNTVEVTQASLADVESLLDKHTDARNPEIVAEHVDYMRNRASTEGLHNAWRSPLIHLLEMAIYGYVSATEAVDAAGDAFVEMRTDPTRNGNLNDEDGAASEYLDLLAWALGKVQAKLGINAEAVRHETAAHVREYYITSLPELDPPVGYALPDEPDTWGPLDPFRAPPSPLALDGLPDVLRQFVLEAAEALQVPTDLVLNHALGALSSAPYGTIQAQIRPGWVVPLNLAVMTLAKSGELKSPLNSVVMKPFDKIETERRDRDREAALDRDAEIAALSTRLEAVKRSLTSSKAAAAAPAPAPATPGGPGYLAVVVAAGSAYAEVAALEREIMRLKGKALRWSSVMDDATPEAVGVRLGSTHTGAAMMRSDETNIFSQIAGQARNGGGTEKAKVYLHGVSGDPIRTDRLGRDEVYVERPALSMALMMQPEVFESTIRNSPQLVDIGIVPRLLIVRPASKVGSRKADPVPMSAAVEDGWGTAVGAIAAAAESHVTRVLAARMAEAETSGKAVPVRQIDPRLITVNSAGWELLRAYKERIEPELGKGGRLEAVRSWGAKSTTYVAQIAALLTLLGNPGATEVDNSYIAVAEKLMDGYALHHLALAEVPTEAAAEAIWGRVGDLDDGKFDADGFIKLTAVRKLIQNQSWFKNADMRDRDELLRDALATLEARGYVKIDRSGRRDSLKIKRRPDTK